MSRAIEKGTVAYFSFDALSIHGAVIKQGVFKRSGSLQLAQSAYGEGKILDESAFSLAFDELCRKLKIRRGMTCAIAIDETEVISRNVEIPSSIPKDEIRGYLLMEIGNSIILPFENVSFDYEVLGEDDTKTDVMLHAVSFELTMALRTYMKKRGLALKKVVPRSVAVANGVMHLSDIDAFGSMLLWHVTPFTHQFFVLEEGQIHFIRSIETGIPYEVGTREGVVTYTSNVSADVKMDEFLNELTQFLDLYRYSLRSDGHQIDQLLISGTVPEVDDLVRSIEAESLVPVTRVEQPLAISHSTPLSHQMLPILGMATLNRDHDTNFINSTDLILRWPIVTGLVVLLIGGGTAGYLYNEVDQLKTEGTRIEQQLQLVTIYQNEQLNSKDQQVLSLDQTVKSLIKVERNAVPALQALTEQLPPTGYVLTYNYGDGSLMSVHTQFETLSDLNEFQRALMTDGRFEDVDLLGVTTEMKATVDETDSTLSEEPDSTLSEEPLPRYIGEFTFTFVDVEEETVTDEEVVSR